MTISIENALNEIHYALANNSSRIVIDKASIASQTAASYCSLWRATGQPGQGAIPAAVAVCNNTFVGAMQFAQQVSPATSYLAYLEAACSNASSTLEIHDRLMHIGSLSGTLTTAQTVGIDLESNLANNNLAERIGDTNYSDVTWWLEWYTATGSTASTATIGVTYNDGTTGNLTVALAATRGASHAIPLNTFIPSAGAGKYIRAINTVQLSASTGTAGNFGVTASRNRAAQGIFVANLKHKANAMDLGLCNVPNEACLSLYVLTSTTSSGTVRAAGKIIHV